MLIYKSALDSSIDVFANTSIIRTLSKDNKMSRSTAINSNASSLPCNMDERMRVFTLFRAEKERSAVAELIGIPTEIAYTWQSVGYASIRW